MRHGLRPRGRRRLFLEAGPDWPVIFDAVNTLKRFTSKGSQLDNLDPTSVQGRMLPEFLAEGRTAEHAAKTVGWSKATLYR